MKTINEEDRIKEREFARHRFKKDMAQLWLDSERIKTEGLIKTLEDARKQGIKEGRELEKMATICRMIEIGMNDEFILNFTDCSMELLKKIRNVME